MFARTYLVNHTLNLCPVTRLGTSVQAPADLPTTATLQVQSQQFLIVDPIVQLVMVGSRPQPSAAKVLFFREKKTF